jgi:hypothetical protein
MGPLYPLFLELLGCCRNTTAFAITYVFIKNEPVKNGGNCTTGSDTTAPPDPEVVGEIVPNAAVALPVSEAPPLSEEFPVPVP